MLLRAISPSDPISNVVLDGLEMTAPILQDMQFYAKPGQASLYRKQGEGATKNKITRSLNEDNTAIPPTPDNQTATKKIISFDSKADVTLEDDGLSPETELESITLDDSVETGYVLQDMAFNGDSAVDAEDLDGMKNLVDAGNVMITDTNGTQVPVASTQANIGLAQLAIEKFYQHAQRVRGGAQFAYMPSDLKARYLTVAKALGYYRLSKDELGNTIDQIGDITIRSVGFKKDGTSIMQFNQTVGTNNDCASIYFARWGEGRDLTVLTSVGVKARYSGQMGNFLINNVNLRAIMFLQNKHALYQSKGWRL